MNKKIGKFTLKSILVLLAIPIALLVIIFIIYYGMILHNGKLIETSLEPFDSVFKAPDSFYVLDATKWKREETIKSPIFTLCEEITIIERDSKLVKQITDILNNKDFKSITHNEYERRDANPNKDVHFWLASSADTNDVLKNYYPFEVIIWKNKTLYLFTSKGKEHRYLKSSITDDELKFIEELYNKRYGEEHTDYYSYNS
ncbi:hypothetical protein [Romboutsia lituseburensis]|uniref:hypothetical protein n=1 Tax=Romboutsia lituseburensis TaxID=1537 RepID=UPI00215B6356|nr:hypothetical protein [Romboutsia lituseburensis]MCR8743882.1 hypothetical protein [Romboutsia lituseburensis]